MVFNTMLILPFCIWFEYVALAYAIPIVINTRNDTIKKESFHAL